MGNAAISFIHKPDFPASSNQKPASFESCSETTALARESDSFLTCHLKWHRNRKRP